MIIAGFKPDSFVDWRGKMVATIFTYGCNFRCPFCHNFHLVTEKPTKTYSPYQIYKIIKDMSEWIDGVCITGGEPTIHKDLPEFIKMLSEIKPVKIDTNGTNPKMLKEIIKYVDYVAMDVKAPPGKYEILTGSTVNPKIIKESIEIIKNNASDYEFRTTFVPYLTVKDIEEISVWIKGSRRYVIQQFSTAGGTLNPKASQLEPYAPEILKKACELSKVNVEECLIVND